VIGMGLGYVLDNQGGKVQASAGQNLFLVANASRTDLTFTQSPIQWVPWALSAQVKRLGSEGKRE